MTALDRNDVIKMIIKIQLNFENAYVTSGDLERELLVESWFEALCDYPKEACNQAVINVLKRAKFAPRLGDIVEEAEKLCHSDLKTDNELWAELTDVLGRAYDVSRYLIYPQHAEWAQDRLDKIYDGLSEDLKLYVVNCAALIEISEMNADALTYERARFFKQMPVLRRQSADRQNAQKFLALTEQHTALPQGENAEILKIYDKKKK